MGCTSSAPNMATINHNATEKTVTDFSDDDQGELSLKKDDNVIIIPGNENGENEIKVLPYDTLADSIQLDSNNKSILDTSYLDTDKGIPTNDAEFLDTKAKENENFQTGEKIISLEDVVERVVELYVTDGLIKNEQDVSDQTAEIDVSIEKNEEIDIKSEKVEECECEPSELKEEHSEETLSPSQSTSSRATRWEALADIAAELPPSLTVDPLTGQIYALSK